METQMIFERYELKYMLTPAQKEELLRISRPYMKEDAYGQTTIRNLYYDTPNYRLIRRSLEKPEYKEKLRMRSYRTAQNREPVFLELKKKYGDKVYKRRTQIVQQEALDRIREKQTLGSSQVEKEIDYFVSFYEDLQPRTCIFYDRTAYESVGGGPFRFTLDENIRYRTDRFSLAEEPSGERILRPDACLLEVKTADAVPVWLSRFFTENGIYRTSFSKYGAAFEKQMKERM
ncbi:MAG: polyphosphate polymerase domain-containing protein [Clostridia bacterium]|nr:polyphosphate polymerase domain-containing protein [Clostridia bacterium]MBR3195369.1 polyphosphate polymerase domain-containing protein [Clostridia bacterium]